MTEMDTDNDGTVDYDEFLEWFNKQSAEAKERLESRTVVVKQANLGFVDSIAVSEPCNPHLKERETERERDRENTGRTAGNYYSSGWILIANKAEKTPNVVYLP